MTETEKRKKQKWTEKWALPMVAVGLGLAAVAIAVAAGPQKPSTQAGKSEKAPDGCRCVLPAKPAIGQALCTYTIARCGCPATLPGNEKATNCEMFPQKELCYPQAGQTCAQSHVQDKFIKSCTNTANECRADSQCQVQTQVEERACAAGPVVSAVEVYESCDGGTPGVCKGACMLKVTAGGDVHLFEGTCAP